MAQAKSLVNNQENANHAGDPKSVNSVNPRIETLDSIAKIAKIPTEPANDGFRDAEFKPSGRVFVAFATLAILILMVSLDGTIISVGLPTIATALHGTATEAFWAGTSFLLASTVFQPTFASLSNIFGRMQLIFISLLLFLAGTLVAGLSQAFFVLLIGRTLQGLGGGGLQSVTEVIVTDLVPLRVRSKYFAVISAAWSLGSVTGPVIGGIFTQKMSWRWMFYINLPFIGIALLIVPLSLRLKSVQSSVVTKFHRIDCFGVFLFTASTTSVLVPITWAGVEHPWTSWRTLTPLSVGVTGLVFFLLYEAYLAPEPLVPLSIFRTRTSCVAYVCETAQGIMMWCILYYLPLYFEASKSYSPISAGLGITPLTVTLAPSAVVMGFIIARSGRYYLANIIGWSVSAIGIGLMTLMDRDTETWKWTLFMVFAGIGQGILVQSLRLTIQAASTNKNLPTAAAMYVFFRCLGQTLGVAIGGVAFQNEVKERLKRYPEFDGQGLLLAKNAVALVEVIKGMPDGSSRKHDLQAVYADAFRVICILLTALSGAMLVACLFVKSYDLNRALETEQGFNYDARPISRVIYDGGESGSGNSKRASFISALRPSMDSRRPSSRRSTLVEFPFEEQPKHEDALRSSSTLQVPKLRPLYLSAEILAGFPTTGVGAQTPHLGPGTRFRDTRSRIVSRPGTAPNNSDKNNDDTHHSPATAVRTPSVLSFSRPLSGSLRDRHNRTSSLSNNRRFNHHHYQTRSSFLICTPTAVVAERIPPALLSSPSALIVPSFSGSDSDSTTGPALDSWTSATPSTPTLTLAESPLLVKSHVAEADNLPPEFVDYVRYMDERFANVDADADADVTMAEPSPRDLLEQRGNRAGAELRTLHVVPRTLSSGTIRDHAPYYLHHTSVNHRWQESAATTGTVETQGTFETARGR